MCVSAPLLPDDVLQSGRSTLELSGGCRLAGARPLQ